MMIIRLALLALVAVLAFAAVTAAQIDPCKQAYKHCLPTKL